MVRRTKSVEEFDKKKLWKEERKEPLDGELRTLITFSSRIGQSRARVKWMINASDYLWRDMNGLQSVTFVPQNEWRILLLLLILHYWTLQFSVRSNSVWISRKNCLLIHIHSAITLLTFFSPTLIITLPRKRCACGKMFIETLLLNLRHTFYYVNENLSLLCIKGYRSKTHVLQYLF